MGGSPLQSISPVDLYACLGTADAPALFDISPTAAYEAADRIIIGAIRCLPEDIATWSRELTGGRPIVVYCADGHQVSRGAADMLRRLGIDARYLAGGIGDWVERRLPTRLKSRPAAPRWVTRERPKIDRIARPWLIRRFIEPQAEFLYAPTERVFAVGTETGAIPYDIPGAEPFSHDGELCSFDAFF